MSDFRLRTVVSISNSMYTLTLEYDTATTSLMQDVNTFTFATDLMLRGVYTDQPTDNSLLFTSSQDLHYALLAYKGNARLAWEQH